MTEQPPSAEAQEIADNLWPLAEVLRRGLARDIDTLIADRVAAETERWQHRDRQRLEQIGRLQETVQSFQSASAERPAPPQRHLTGGEREVLHKALLASSTLVHSGDAKQTRPSDLTQDYTERARELLRRIGDAHGRETQSRYYEDNKPSVKLVVDALSAVASEHQAAAIRAFGSRVWSDTEEVAYRAGATNERAALLARLQEPDVREAVHIIMYDDKRPLEKVDAALAKIAEMLK